MWVSLVFPTWASVPLPFGSVGETTVVALPVSISLLIWGGLAFLFIPFIMLVLNAVAAMSSASVISAWPGTPR